MREKIIQISELLATNELNKCTNLENADISQLKEFLNLLREEKKRLENEVSNLRSDCYSTLSES